MRHNWLLSPAETANSFNLPRVHAPSHGDAQAKTRRARTETRRVRTKTHHVPTRTRRVPTRTRRVQAKTHVFGPKHATFGPKHGVFGPEHAVFAPKHAAFAPKHAVHTPMHAVRSPPGRSAGAVALAGRQNASRRRTRPVLRHPSPRHPERRVGGCEGAKGSGRRKVTEGRLSDDAACRFSKERSASGHAIASASPGMTRASRS